MQKYIKLQWILVSSFVFLLANCGGGSDSKTVQGFAGDLTQTAEGLVDVTKSACLPQVPTWNRFNAYANEWANAEPLMSTYISISEGSGSGGSTSIEIPVQDQNTSMMEVFEDLVMRGKNLGAQALAPQNSATFGRFKEYSVADEDPSMRLIANKEVYSQIKTRCRDLECIGQSVFGKSWGSRFYFKDTYGLSVSGYVNPNDEAYKGDDSVKSVLWAISSFPQGTFPIAKNRFNPNYQVFADNIVISPFEEGKSPGKGVAGITQSIRQGNGLIVNADINMFDIWKASGFYSRGFVVFHELMHLMDQTKKRRATLSQSQKWQSLSNWEYNKNTNTWASDDKLMCSTYGATSPTEDFAECGVLYRYAPKTLKKISREKYNYLRENVFNGVEYIEDRDCMSNQVKFF